MHDPSNLQNLDSSSFRSFKLLRLCSLRLTGDLQEKILKAQSRIYLSTLYIGKTEHELVSIPSSMESVLV
jgi:hypothetical protein